MTAAARAAIDTAATEARLYRHIVGARIRSDWQYRSSFFTFLLAQTTFVALELVSLVILISLVSDLGGWTGSQVLFMYGLGALSFAVGDVFVSEVERLANNYIRTGNFDVVLMRPCSPLLQILALEFELRRAGKILPPVAALAWAGPNLGVDWTAGRLGAVVGAVICGSVIHGAVWVLAGSITFWAVASNEATNALTYGGQFANQYPLHIYPGWIRVVMGLVLPLAFVAYIPTVFVADTANPLGLPAWLAVTPPLVAGLMAAAAFTAWRSGIRHYQSTGS